MFDNIKTNVLDIITQPSIKTELHLILNYVLNVLFSEISPIIYTVFALIFMIFIMNVFLCIGCVYVLTKKYPSSCTI